MHNKTNLSWTQVQVLAIDLEREVLKHRQGNNVMVYGVPRGGIPVAALLHHHDIHLVDNPRDAHVFVDDLIDTGRTRDQFALKYPERPFLPLLKNKDHGVWYVFPWERMMNENGPEENVIRILEYIGEDPKREGLLETPQRVVKSWGELYGGYKQDPQTVLKHFEDGACDSLVVLRNVEWWSNCEHHIQTFHGKAHIGYLPNKRVVGISKLARLLEIFTRRLQIQERIGLQVTQALMDSELKPLGAGCVLIAAHNCMRCRGVRSQNSEMVTSSLRGLFLTAPALKDEFLRVCGM